jgi:hypothetical protein
LNANKRMPEFRGSYRVLVLEDPGASREHRVNAVCLELNFVGRGRAPGEALSDLAGCALEALRYQLGQVVPAHKPNPDPELVRVFESNASSTSNGEMVLDRAHMNIAWSLEKRPRMPAAKLKPQHRVTFQSCYA